MKRTFNITEVKVKVYNLESKKIEDVTLTLSGQITTVTGVEKAIQREYESYKLLEILSFETKSVTREMSTTDFIKYSKVVKD